MNIIIRPIKVSDAKDINEMRRMSGVMETTLGIESERIDFNSNFIAALGEESHVFVAETDYVVTEQPTNKENTKVLSFDSTSTVIGMCGLHINKCPRKRHSASVGLMVHTDFQNKGIGTNLFEKLIDLSDKWLMLRRLELLVFEDNERAIELYKKFDFIVEGKKIGSVIQNGKYANELIMARTKG